MADHQSSTTSPQIDTEDILRQVEEVARDCSWLPYLFRRIRRRRSRARTTADGREILFGYRYEKRRREVLERDGYRCVECGSAYLVEVHHRTKRSVLRDDRPENLISLCTNCHGAEHEE